MLAVADELRVNREMAQGNQTLVAQELELLGEDAPRVLINPLYTLGEGFWDLIRPEPPDTLVARQGLAHAERVVRATRRVNEMIRSRELFRAVNPEGLHEVLARCDELIQQLQDGLFEAIEEFERLLEPPPPPFQLIWRPVRFTTTAGRPTSMQEPQPH